MENKTICVKIVVASLCFIRPIKLISEREKDLINKLLLERISLAGIARAVEVSELWLQSYISELYASCPEDLCADLPDQAAMESCPPFVFMQPNSK
jgi:hypothetical protein